MSKANRLALCRTHHERFHAGLLQIPRDLLPAEVFEFAAELGLSWWLDKRYPVVVAA